MMNDAYRGLTAFVAVLILVALGMAASESRMMGVGMLWSSTGAGAPADGEGSGAWIILGWLMMLVSWGAVIAGVVLLVRVLIRTGSSSSGSSAVDMLRRRYEAGEMTREQYELACQALRGRPARRRGGT